jgi:uncharacterized protein YkwD
MRRAGGGRPTRRRARRTWYPVPMVKRAMFKVVAVAGVLSAAPALAFLSTPVRAMDLNSFRAQHGRPPLMPSAALSGAAYAHANALASRGRLDHKGFRQRLGAIASTAAENVLTGCPTEDCAIRQWAKSGGHRSNMLMQGVSSYGLASATSANGKRYWVLELGN